MSTMKSAMATARATRKDDSGFTLIELAVVIIIIGILLELAIPAFLSMRASAHDAVAKTDLRNMYAATVAYHASHDEADGWKLFISENGQDEYSDGTGSNSALFTTSSFPGGGNALNPVGASNERQLGAQVSSSDGFLKKFWTNWTAVTLVASSRSGKCFYLRSDQGVITKGWTQHANQLDPNDPACYTDDTTPDGFPASPEGEW
jgi:prepilin-type N-terminal cleavage/methylation domain-containing protein